MRRFVFENSLSIFFAAIFAATLLGQSFAGQHAYNAEQHAHGGVIVAWLECVLSPEFGGQSWRTGNRNSSNFAFHLRDGVARPEGIE